MSDQRSTPSDDSHDATQSDETGLYAPKKRYSRDIPVDDEGPPDAPVVKGSDPGAADDEANNDAP